MDEGEYGGHSMQTPQAHHSFSQVERRETERLPEPDQSLIKQCKSKVSSEVKKPKDCHELAKEYKIEDSLRST